MPSTVPNLADEGWENEAATKVYFELLADAFEITPVVNLDALFEAKFGRADYVVRYGNPRDPHVLEVKPDLRRFLYSIGPDGSDLYEGIKTDDEAYEPYYLAWPSIVFAGRDKDNHRERLEKEFPGEIIVADEDVPKVPPTYSEFQQSLERSFEYYVNVRDREF
jgi:hypothetical protein